MGVLLTLICEGPISAERPRGCNGLKFAPMQEAGDLSGDLPRAYLVLANKGRDCLWKRTARGWVCAVCLAAKSMEKVRARRSKA